MKARRYIYFLLGLGVLAAGWVFAWGFVLPAFRGTTAIRADYFIGPVRLHMYSLTFFLALLTGYLLALRSAPLFGLSRAWAEDLVLLNVVAGFVGARIFHVISQWSYYATRPVEIFLVWHGGLAIYGGMVFGLAATLIYCRVKKIDFFRPTDLLALSLSAGLAIGRWGNFFNQEAYGYPTALPWKMYVATEKRLTEYLGNSFFHPVFLYESLWMLLVFWFLLSIAKRVQKPGVLFGWFTVLYGSGRFVLESFRSDAIYYGGFRINQIWSLAFAFFGAALLIWLKRRSRRLVEKPTD
jgi:phosphatidylglycerol:prolipoprotein diacylglycerol transferase